MNRCIVSHQTKIDNLFNKISTIPDPADQSEWSKYLCILVSGYIEESLRILLEEYAQKNASPNIQNFVSKEIRNITNCKTNKILDILCKFNSSWKDSFNNEITSDSEIKDAVDSIIANRHKIAHGKSAGITYVTVSKYYTNVKKAVKILNNIIQ